MINKNSKCVAVALVLLLSISATSVNALSWDAGVRRMKTGVNVIKKGASNAWSFVAAKFKKKKVEKQEETQQVDTEEIEISEKPTTKRLVSRIWAKAKTISSKIKLGSRIKNGWVKVKPFSRLKNGYSKVAGFLGYVFSRKISLKQHESIVQDLTKKVDLHKKEKNALEEKLSGKKHDKMVECRKRVNNMLDKNKKLEKLK